MKVVLVIDVDKDELGEAFADITAEESGISFFARGVIRPLPQKIVGKREMFMPTYSLGWNDCIGTMLGEEEGNNGLKPLKDENHEYYGCPSCRHIVSSVQNYCENCGQKLDWKDIGETE